MNCEKCKTNNHYGRDGLSPVEAFEQGLVSHNETVGFYKCCIIKYLNRYSFKDGEKDLEKAIHYLEMLKEFEYGE